VRLARIVSGGQTGADRAALDAALASGVPVGGWCPQGGLAEDLPTPPGLLDDSPFLRETPSADPQQRTTWNVRDSDATVVLTLAAPSSPGTAMTVREAARLGRPWAVLPADDRAVLAGWLAVVDPTVLNVAGPRESQDPGVYAAAYRTVCAVLRGE
jgi:hypothetical protein